MKKITFFKTLLVAAGLLGGSNAWADAGDVTTLFNIDFSNPLVDLGTTAAVGVPNYTCTGSTGTMSIHGQRISGAAYNPSISANNTLYYVGTATAPITPNAGAKDIITFEFDIANANLTGRSAYFYMYAGETKVGAFNYTKYSSGSITENTFDFELSDINTAGNANSDWATHNHFKIVYNYETGKCTAKVTQYTNTTTEGATATHETEFDTSVAFTSFVVGSSHTTRMPQFDNLVITKTEGDYASSSNITLAFQDNLGNDISALYTGQTDFAPDNNTTFTPSDYYPTYMYDDDYRYVYTSGGDAFTVTEDATVTLVYTREARPAHTITIVQNYGGNNKTLSTESVKEQSSYTYYYPRYILDGTTLYQYTSSTDENASASYWMSTTTCGMANASYTLTYTAVEGNCVYYSETEDEEGKTANYAYSDWKKYMSNGACGVLEDATTLINLPAGVYSITVRAVGRSDRYVQVYKSSTSGEQILNMAAGNSGNTNSYAFTLSEATNIVAVGGYNAGTGTNGHGFDYIYIMKTGDVQTLTSSANLDGYKTYYNATKNFEVDANTTIYKAATPSNGYVTITAVEGSIIPAATPVFLKTTDTESYAITLTETDEDGTGDFTGNALQAAEEDGEIDGAYILAYTTDGGLGIYQYTSLLDAGDVYLTAAGQGAKLRFGFADDATAIKTVAVEAADNAAIYNLSGQRVNAAYKGIVINNGKKYLNK